jgi:hypothetical protein
MHANNQVVGESMDAREKSLKMFLAEARQQVARPFRLDRSREMFLAPRRLQVAPRAVDCSR